MQLDKTRAAKCLKNFDFKTLFIEELGWDRHSSTLDVAVNNDTYQLAAIAHKRGFVAYTCPLPVKSLRVDETIRKIDTQVAKTAHEHIIVYTDSDKDEQIWQWAKREQGKPIARRHEHYFTSQSGERLIQKLENLAFTLEDEENLTVVDVAGRAKAAFDLEKVTKKFYDRFQKEHDVFLKFIEGIPDKELGRWYASIMLNRLMFIYFIQKKGFLDSNIHYLANKLTHSKQKAKNRYYKDFLCPLFFEGFAKPLDQRNDAMKKLLGNIPYLNGGIFQKHQIEELHGKTIEVPDSAFDKIFNFFEEYDWHLDDRPTRNDREINPDVLGYIFEKYINQKQMGAYYTKEDITGYISQNTVIPRIFDMAKEKCKIAFEGEQSVWRLLKDNPDRYIYDAVKKGANLTLPPDISVGLDTAKPNLLERRKDWNKTAPAEYALPTEIWREVVARRNRYEEVKAKLANGEVKSINDLITYNLDIRQFAQDVVENCEGPELLRAIWYSIVGRIPRKSNEKFEAGISILDPTCGSGAFLFAALNILEPLYEACLERMQLFVGDLERSGKNHSPEKFIDFREILKEVSDRPNAKYFIYKSIIINNLFGVDIMDEAIEICKLRLFLKLVAQVDTVEKIEPLPDIDFNIKAGNTLVGYANLDEVKKAVKSKLDFGNALAKITEKAEDVDRLFLRFRQQQVTLGGKITVEDKTILTDKLKSLENELNGFLAEEYGIDPAQKNKYENWLKSHRPFHWFVDFYGIIKNGGFDVIIGNPPYVEYPKVRDVYSVKYYRTESCANLYAFCSERAFALLRQSARFGMILPNSSISAAKMQPLQEIFVSNNHTWVSNFAWRPSKLFEGADMLLAIIISNKFCTSNVMHSTCYHKWFREYRDYLFSNIVYSDATARVQRGSIPKLAGPILSSILNKLKNNSNRDTLFTQFKEKETRFVIFYFRAVQYWLKILDKKPIFKEEGKSVTTGEMKPVYADNQEEQYIFASTLSSSLFFLYYITWSSCQVVNNRDFDLPFSTNNIESSLRKKLSELGQKLEKDYESNSKLIKRNYAKRGRTFTMLKQHFYIKESKPIIDEIDKVLAKHYGFTDEELDFIINYDIKYRMGKDSEQDCD